MTRSGVFFILSALLLLLLPDPAFADSASDVKCTGCVGSPDILDGGVKPKDIAAEAVTAGKIKNGAVNANKLAKGAVDWQKLAVSLQERIVQLEATVAALEDNTVLKLDGFLDLDTTDPSRPTARFAGVNVQVVNGTGVSWSANGLGNVILGYDETFSPFFGDDPICSIGYIDSQEECESEGGVWASDHKSGSHNVVAGPAHRYSQFGGLVIGQANAITGHFTSVTGGFHNKARGNHSSISGGDTNEAIGGVASVGGGMLNIAGGGVSSVSGGYQRTVNGEYDWAAGSLFEEQ